MKKNRVMTVPDHDGARRTMRIFELGLLRALPTLFLKDFYARGMRRLAEYGFPSGSQVVETSYGFKMRADRLDVIKWYLYYFGVFEPVISESWRRVLSPGDVILDIGGNIGYHALLASTLVGPTGKVVTFEPSERIFCELCENIALNKRDNITANRQAVSDRAGVVALSYAGKNSQGNSSIVRDLGDVGTEQVECVSFDEIARTVDLSSVSLIKIDVEGAEPMVLRSLYAHLSTFPKSLMIFLEISPENVAVASEMIRPFIDSGFVARSIRNDYDTKFYIDYPEPDLCDLNFQTGTISDIVMCRDVDRLCKIPGGNVTV